jgi:hypothetical protein
MKFSINIWPMMAEGEGNFIIVKIKGGMCANSRISNPNTEASAQVNPTRVG